MAKRIRQQEYLDCLSRNLTSSVVGRVVLLVEGASAMALLQHEIFSSRALSSEEKAKVVPILVPQQPTYAALFGAANKLFSPVVASSHQTAPLCMVCNADIHFPSREWCDTASVGRLFYRMRNRASAGGGADRLVLALTRYENEDTWEAPLISDYRGSHDAFLFQPPLPPQFISAVAHPQNCYKSENIVIHELRSSANALVLNPCRDFRVVHRHAADVRQWLPPVDEIRYGRAEPITFEQAFAAIG